MTRIWIDVLMPSEASFFGALLPLLSKHEIYLTAADSAETLPLLQLKRIPYKKIACHPTSRGIVRQLSIARRALAMSVKAPQFDLSLSFANFYAVLTAFERRKPSIVVTDNDKIENLHYRLLTLRRSRLILCPEAIPRSKLDVIGVGRDRIIQFPGYKEDAYIADFLPDPDFRWKVPFRHYVVLRPEALFASYLDSEHSIVPKLCSSLVREGLNVVYLPRSKDERLLVRECRAVFIPEPLNGLDLCWHADAVLTGSGSIAREAALLGVPAISFFPGELLSVDKELVLQGKMYHSRNVESIVSYVISVKHHRSPLEEVTERSSSRRRRFFDYLEQAIESSVRKTD